MVATGFEFDCLASGQIQAILERRIFMTPPSIFISWTSVTPATGLDAETSRAPSFDVIFMNAPVPISNPLLIHQERGKP